MKENHDGETDADLTGDDEAFDRAVLEIAPREDLIDFFLQLSGRLVTLTRRSTLMKAYLLTALGSALGLGLHVYTSYRLPLRVVTPTRILNTIGAGLLFGPIIGLGIFLTRLIVHRLRNVGLVSRLALGILVGTVGVYLGIDAFDVLFLNAWPPGWSAVMGSAFVVLGFAISAGLVRLRALRALISAAGVGLGIGLPWLLCVSYPCDPLLHYWLGPPVQTIVLIIVTSLLIGSIPQLADLSPA